MRQFSSPACLQHELEEPGSAIVNAGIRIKRVYEEPDRLDGRRFLIDRLWPRGLSKAAASLDGWLRDLAPSPELRRWFGHDPKRWQQFQMRYRSELRHRQAELNDIRTVARHCRVTLLYGARDPKVNHAVVLLAVLRRVRVSSDKPRRDKRKRST